MQKKILDDPKLRKCQTAMGSLKEMYAAGFGSEVMESENVVGLFQCHMASVDVLDKIWIKRFIDIFHSALSC